MITTSLQLLQLPKLDHLMGILSWHCWHVIVIMSSNFLVLLYLYLYKQNKKVIMKHILNRSFVVIN